MLNLSTSRRTAPALRLRGVVLGKCIKPNAFGNALGSSFADANSGVEKSTYQRNPMAAIGADEIGQWNGKGAQELLNSLPSINVEGSSSPALIPEKAGFNFLRAARTSRELRSVLPAMEAAIPSPNVASEQFIGQDGQMYQMQPSGYAVVGQTTSTGRSLSAGYLPVGQSGDEFFDGSGRGYVGLRDVQGKLTQIVAPKAGQEFDFYGRLGETSDPTERMKLLDYSCNKWGAGCLEYNEIGAALYPQERSYQNRVNQYNYLQNAVLDFGVYSVGTAGILATGGGLPTLKVFMAGGTIATTANVSVQMATSEPNEGIKVGEAANAFITGGMTFGRKQLYSAAVNGWGAFTTATLQGDNVGVKVSAAVVGSLLGGVVGEKGSQFIANAAIASSIRFESQWLSNSLLNTYSPMKNVVPSYISEGTGVAFDKLNDKINPPKK